MTSGHTQHVTCLLRIALGPQTVRGSARACSRQPPDKGGATTWQKNRPRVARSPPEHSSWTTNRLSAVEWTPCKATMLGWPARYVVTAMSLRRRRSARAPSRVARSAAASTALPAYGRRVALSTQRSTGPHGPRPSVGPAAYSARTLCGGERGASIGGRGGELEREGALKDHSAQRRPGHAVRGRPREEPSEPGIVLDSASRHRQGNDEWRFPSKCGHASIVDKKT